MTTLKAICFLIGICILLCMLGNFAQAADLKKEMPTIRKAAIRNGIKVGSEDWYRLLAIRKAENGKKGREFGIFHPRCDAEMKRRPNETLDIQAGWAAASIFKGRKRWIKAGKPGDFTVFMGKRYCDPKAHPLNKHWVKNVNYWMKKLRRKK